MRTRLTAPIAVLAGVTLITTVIVTSLFSRTAAFERLSDNTRAAFSDEAIATQTADVDALGALAVELPQALTLLGSQAGLTDAQLAAFISSFPAVEQGLAALPALATGLKAGAATVAAEQGHFRSADSIATSSTPSTTIPWFLVITGALAVLAGIALMRPAPMLRRGTIVLGLIILLTPVVTSLPTKSANADALNDGVRSLFTNERVVELRTAAAAVEGFGAAVQTDLLPAIGELLQTEPAAVADGLATFFPAIGDALARGPAAVGRLRAQADLLEANIGDFQTSSGAGYRPIAWMTVAMGAIIALAGLMSMVGRGAVDERAQEPRHTRRLRRAA